MVEWERWGMSGESDGDGCEVGRKRVEGGDGRDELG